jgi:lysozyme
MQVSERGLDLIKKWEGLRLVAYLDAANPPVWTIGYGSTVDVAPGMKITQVQAEERLKKDVHFAENCVNKLVTVPLLQQEFDALVSLVFNIGCGNFRSSTLLRLINEGDDDAGMEFRKWTRAGDTHPPGTKTP